MTAITLASTDEHLEAILALQRRNHARVLPADAQSREGFVFTEHHLDLLRRMAAQSPQAIAVAEDGRVVGYCLSLPLALQAEVPMLAPMFEQFGRCAYRDRPLSTFRFFIGGQVCVEREHRGQGLLARLYERLRALFLARGYELCVTEVATRNGVSLRAHERMGFEVTATYQDHAGEEWAIVVWDLSRAALIPEPSRAVAG